MERKRAKTDDADELQNVDYNLVMSMERLQEAQDDLDQANEAANDKVLEIEQVYMEKRRPIYQRRNEVIQKIPEFWLTAFLSHPHLRDLLTEEDQKAFKYLQSLNVEDLGDIKSGYKITFEFGPNPYFEDNKLCKVFKYGDDASTTESGNAPHWKDGMDLTKPKKTETKEKKRPRKTDSFFNWFSEHVEEELVVGMMQDEIADIIKDDLWVNPLRYFNNENGSDSDDDEGDDDEGDDDEEEDEDSDEDDE
ncbi:NAP1-related protein 2 [Cryptomeria japonica]|uniref:NAP1-related protein 2 n=1 Tax=Cryptomeria japonica TaxID=3369 RepID=UPI0025AC4135|nr:NAP1-related protein 2 [Cryptomeria japonica]XP_057816647.1 NAP1-related protein 2 [Cryptomeria japonica]